jgi:ABC-type Fe3+ transport system permease subunit
MMSHHECFRILVFITIVGRDIPRLLLLLLRNLLLLVMIAILLNDVWVAKRTQRAESTAMTKRSSKRCPPWKGRKSLIGILAVGCVVIIIIIIVVVVVVVVEAVVGPETGS